MRHLRKWLERRFWDFRYGHGTYLAYAIGLFNFIILNYYLLISNIPFLQRIFPHLWIFALAFTPTYFFLAIIVGWLIFRKRQLKTDVEVSAMENPYRFKAVVPSRETVLDLPITKFGALMTMQFYKQIGLLTPEVKEVYDYYLTLIDKLIAGEDLKEEMETKEYQEFLRKIANLMKGER